MIVLEIVISLLAFYANLHQGVHAGTVLSRRSGTYLEPHKRQMPNKFNPSPNLGFKNPTVQIADPVFGTAI
jgi:hypothetical protein